MENRNYYTITFALLGAIKLALNSVFNIEIITDQQVNELANGVAAVLAIGGVIMTHIKNKKEVSK